MEIEEIWKDVKGYEGKYQVSNYGRVKSLNYMRTGEEQIMKPGINSNGYRFIKLSNGKKKTFRMCRLVYRTFVSEIPKWNPKEKGDTKLEINHIDENKLNDCLWNLELVTHSKNLLHGTGLARLSKALLNNEKHSKKVYQYTLIGELVKIWASTRECERSGFNSGNIASCCRGERKTAHGYIWSYKPL